MAVLSTAKRQKIDKGWSCAMWNIGSSMLVCMYHADAFENALKLKFVKESMQKQYSFRKQAKLCKDLTDVVDWIATKSQEEVL